LARCHPDFFYRLKVHKKSRLGVGKTVCYKSLISFRAPFPVRLLADLLCDTR